MRSGLQNVRVSPAWSSLTGTSGREIDCPVETRCEINQYVTLVMTKIDEKFGVHPPQTCMNLELLEMNTVNSA